jgi:hypothetical protein
MQHRHALHRHLVGQLGAASGCEVKMSATVAIRHLNWLKGFTCLNCFCADLGFARANDGVVQDLDHALD